MGSAPTDASGRFLFLVTWGPLARADSHAVLVWAYDDEEARAVARAAFPERLPPDAAMLASEVTARAVLDGRHDPRIGNLRVLS